MAWEIEVTDQYQEWYYGLEEDQQQAVDARIERLEQDGPNLKRPLVGEIVTSRHRNMKELRCSEQGALRVLFTFDPRRTAIILLGGDKTGEWDEWYRVNVPRADDLYDEYLQELKDEGLL